MARGREEEEPAAAMAQWPDSFPDSEVVNKAVSFFHHVKAQFAENVYEEFLGLFQGFLTGETPDPGKVMADVYELLQGHPDLVRLLDALIPAPQPAREDPAPTRPKRERRPTAAAAIDHKDADTCTALAYLERVSSKGKALHERVLALIFQLGSEETVDANQIYERARAVFGSKHSDLLDEFTEYLPVPTERQRDLLLRPRRAKTEPSPEEHSAPAPKRKTVAVAADNHPSAAKRTRADDRKTTNRRANSPAPNNGGFRETWEFETTYTKLVDTIKRIEALLKQYEPTRKDAPARPPRGRRAFEELFPDRDCQEVLREMYRGMLAPIRAALEDGARTELALRTIQRRLEMLERLAVKVAMERRDRDRVEGRMQKLAIDRVLFLRKKAVKQRAKQSAGSMGPALQLKSEIC